jgi:hypothetical protein
MTEAKHIDFDAFRAEQEEVPVTFTIGGMTYDLPPSLPASIAVDVIRMKSEEGDEAQIPEAQLFEFCASVFGSELWKTIIDRHRVTMTEVPALLSMVLEAYTDGPKAEASSTSPKTESSSSSSSRGRGSKRTSSGSTKST